MEKPKSETLDNIFEAGLTLHGDVIDSTEDTVSESVQDNVKKAILMLEDATRLVSVLDLFSRNENFQEIQTEHLKYFLLPALLGDLAGKLTGGERPEAVETAQVYYVDYLQRCKDYGLANLATIPSVTWMKGDDDEKENAPVSSGRPDLAKMNAERSGKMERYKQSKQLESDIKELRQVLARGRDEEVVRQFHLKLIQRFVNSSLDELCSLEMEVGMLRHMALVKAGKVEPQEAAVPVRKLQPVIITKDKMQKEVYGLGYPSLPVLSVDEFYEKRVADGWWKPAPATGTALQDRAKDPDLDARMMDLEEREKDEKVDRDDPEALAKARAWEEWKDDHRRGEGNRKNMG
jgi:immunoglobulin-binding protein 1